MFTGIIESVGEVLKASPEGSLIKFSVKNSKKFGNLKVGGSLSVNGVCLTFLNIEDHKTHEIYDFEVSGETVSKSNLGMLSFGSRVNLERPLSANDRFEGHIVLGHVDTMVKFLGQSAESGGEKIFRFGFDPKYARFFIEKGSAALNGVSLTTFDVTANSFSVVVLPYTLEKTNFKYLKTGDPINCEADVLGKYVARIMDAGGMKQKSKIDLAFLREHGF